MCLEIASFKRPYNSGAIPILTSRTCSCHESIETREVGVGRKVGLVSGRHFDALYAHSAMVGNWNL